MDPGDQRAHQSKHHPGSRHLHALVPSYPPEPPTYTWTFTPGNDAAGGIVAYTGVSTVTPIDGSAGKGNASSKNITAPSITIPAGDNSDKLVGFFSIARATNITGPKGMSKLWSFPAIGLGTGVA